MTDFPDLDTARPRGSRLSRSALTRNMYSSPGRAVAIMADQMPVFLSLVIVPAPGFQLLKLPVTETVSAFGAQTWKSVPVMRPLPSRWTMAPRVCPRASAATATASVGSGTGEGAATTDGARSGAGRAISCAAASRKSVAAWGSSRVPSRKRTVTESGSTRTSLTRAPAGTSTFPATRPSYMAGKVTSSRRVTVSG